MLVKSSSLVLLGVWITQAAAIACRKQYNVQPGDTCESIVKATGITLRELYRWNPTVQANCANLNVAQVCLGPSVQQRYVQIGDSSIVPNMPPTSSSSGVTQPTGIPPTTTTGVPTTTTSTPSPTHKPTYLAHLTVAVADETHFCMFLPTTPGNKAGNNGTYDNNAISDSEKNATTFCTQKDLTSHAKKFPLGFIKTAKYQYNNTAGFVQVTGKINRVKYHLKHKDQGGQYDNHGKGSPPKSMCVGYPYYVQLIEPDQGDYCIRCCANYADCNASRSQYGCKRVVPVLPQNVD
ncbi:hypothetical protein BC940DRAFT_304718 [Gongronella butleri]|nr:hypothetical protein BC940DRAFT_304718 [Gongronella butleri]